ncbi:MAG: amino acid permease [Lactobacillaceae bacterium]|jgi:APA family basic amino acid/polyamine antiporter|nr:amino acid permease [Lactobacillaceae bacterium]
MQNKVELKRTMGLSSGLALVIGTVIGSGIFFKQANVLQTAGNPTVGLLAWIAGGIITLTAGLTIAEIGARIPKTGGMYSYIETLYGPLLGFLTGWVQVIVYAPAVIASIAGYAAFLTANFLGVSTGLARWIAVVFVILIAGLNMLDNRITASFQVITTSIKLIPIGLLIIYGLFFGQVNAFSTTLNAVTSTHTGSFGMAILATLFAYDGWILLANLAGELKNPKRDLPRSIIFGLLLVLIAYVGVTLGVYHALPAEQIAKLGDNTTFYVAEEAFGVFGGRALSIAIIISMWGTLNGKMMAFPRMAYAMANDGLFPHYLSKLHPKTREPINAISTLTLMTIALIVFTNSADRLSNMAIFTIWIFYTAAFFGIFILRHKAKRQPDEVETLFKTPLFPLTPLVAISGALFVLGSTIISDLPGVLASIFGVLLGIPVYWYFAHKK